MHVARRDTAAYGLDPALGATASGDIWDDTLIWHQNPYAFYPHGSFGQLLAWEPSETWMLPLIQHSSLSVLPGGWSPNVGDCTVSPGIADSTLCPGIGDSTLYTGEGSIWSPGIGDSNSTATQKSSERNGDTIVVGDSTQTSFSEALPFQHCPSCSCATTSSHGPSPGQHDLGGPILDIKKRRELWEEMKKTMHHISDHEIFIAEKRLEGWKWGDIHAEFPPKWGTWSVSWVILQLRNLKKRYPALHHVFPPKNRAKKRAQY